MTTPPPNGLRRLGAGPDVAVAGTRYDARQMKILDSERSS